MKTSTAAQSSIFKPTMVAIFLYDFVVMGTTKTRVIEVELTDTVAAFRKKVVAVLGLPAGFQHFRMRSGLCHLEDGQRTLASHGIKAFSNVYAICRPPPRECVQCRRNVEEQERREIVNMAAAEGNTRSM